jgi:CspA family cold shock protein
MSKGRDFRQPRRRGFDDDMPQPYDTRGPAPRPPARPFGGPSSFDQSPAAGPVVEATVKWFNPEKGFGFAELADGSGDAFLHIGALQAAGHEAVAPASQLKVQVGQGAKGMQITRVIEVDESTAQAQPPRAPRPGFGGPGMGGGRPPRFTPDASSAVSLDGSVKWFNPEKGFGFVATQDGGKDVFVHISILSQAGISHLMEGQTVSMKVVDTPKGREALSISLGD